MGDKVFWDFSSLLYNKRTVTAAHLFRVTVSVSDWSRQGRGKTRDLMKPVFVQHIIVLCTTSESITTVVVVILIYYCSSNIVLQLSSASSTFTNIYIYIFAEDNNVNFLN